MPDQNSSVPVSAQTKRGSLLRELAAYVSATSLSLGLGAGMSYGWQLSGKAFQPSTASPARITTQGVCNQSLILVGSGHGL